MVEQPDVHVDTHISFHGATDKTGTYDLLHVTPGNYEIKVSHAGFASQTALLKEMASLAKDDPGPSPLADSLEKLSDAFLLVHEGLKGVSARLDHLPAAVRAELEQPAKRAEG